MFMFMPIVGLDSNWAYEPGSGPEQEKINVKRDVRGWPKKKRDVRGSPTAQMTKKKEM